MNKSTSISGIICYYAVAFFALLLLAAMASCSQPHWYGSSHDGCQQSQGFAGFGNKK